MTSIVATSETQWVSQSWGEMGVKRFATAPYPDDSRANGYTAKGTFYPCKDHYDDNTVVLAIPRGFKATDRVDIIVFFHGHNNEAQRALLHYKLGEQLRDSGRNAILVVPQGAKNVPDEDIGQFEKPHAFARFLDEAIATLRQDGKVPENAVLGSLILSGHSGGYWPIGKVLDKGGITPSVREIWLFDAAYGALREISAPFADPKNNLRLRSVFTDHLQKKNMQIRDNLTSFGRTCRVFEEDQLTTLGTSEQAFRSTQHYSPDAKPGEDELLALLRSEPTLFLHSRLEHDAVPMQNKYFEKFALQSPFLTQRGR